MEDKTLDRREQKRHRQGDTLPAGYGELVLARMMGQMVVRVIGDFIMVDSQAGRAPMQDDAPVVVQFRQQMDTKDGKLDHQYGCEHQAHHEPCWRSARS